MATGSTKPETVVFLHAVTVGHPQRQANGDLLSASGALLSASSATSRKKQVVFDS